MNLPEYRRALRAAMQQYTETVEGAGRLLDEAIEKINATFFDDENRPVKAREYERD